MKKALVLAMAALLLAALLTGCDASVSKVGSGGGTAGGTAQPASNEQQKTEFNLGDQVKVDDTVMTVTKAAKYTPKNEFEKPEDGKVYYMVTVSLANNGKEAADYNAFNYKIQDANGVQTDSTMVSDAPSPMNSGSLAPGGKLTSNLMFQVPKDMKGLKLIMEPNIFSKQQISVTLTK